MGILLLVVIIGITYIAFVDGAYHDADYTVRSKTAAKKDGAMTYTQYKKGGKLRQHRMMTTNEVVRESIFGDGNMLNKKGQVVFNKYDLENQKGQEVVTNICKSKGYDFAPIFIRWADKNKMMYGKYQICTEFSTGKRFIWKEIQVPKADPNYKEGEILCYRWYEDNKGLFGPDKEKKPYYFKTHIDSEVFNIMYEGYKNANVRIY